MERGSRAREERPRRRSRSLSHSEDERQYQRDRKARKMAEREKSDGRDDRRGEQDSGKDRRVEGDRKRHRSRSRSPTHESRRKHDSHDSKHKSTRERSPYRSSRDKEVRSIREGSATQATRKNKGPLPSQASSFQANGDPSMAMVVTDEKEPVDKQKPNFAPTGLLAAASNSVTQADGSAIALKYHEPAEARKPPARDEWKLFVFKGADIVETVELSRRSCWLVGRELAVVDMGAEHPSVSKQHAVIQFRYIEKKNEYGDKTGRVRPYLIDLESANGTSLNKEGIPPSRYLELRDKDMIQFGHSTREYVLMLSPKS